MSHGGRALLGKVDPYFKKHLVDGENADNAMSAPYSG